ncbi:MAG: hypothetical protein CMP51_00300 [Flavobacteriales bacterium]|nr:hypothetical protein [Flavobacteriales bacterium]
MVKIKPFRAIRPKRDKVGLVASRSYLTYTKSNLKEKLENNPYTFLHIINPDYNSKKKITYKEKLKKVKNKYLKFIKKNILIQDNNENLYIYQQETLDQKYIGIIACVSAEDYIKKNIKVHEETITNREEKFKEYLNEVGYNAEPVLLTYNDNEIINNLILKHIKNRAEYEFTTTNKVTHKMWIISDSRLIMKITSCFEKTHNIYIADGHHRIASSSLLHSEKSISNKYYLKNSDYFMCYLLPFTQLKIINFNRLIKIKNHIDKSKIIEEIKKFFTVKKINSPEYSPKFENEISMYFEGNWFSLLYNKIESNMKISKQIITSILSDKILTPILGIIDEKTDEDIKFVEGNICISKIKREIDKLNYDIAFILKPISIKQLKKVADNDEIMPPKSTYILPKLRSGLTIYNLND